MSISPLRIAVFASGSGSNLESILTAVHDGTLQNTEVGLVISNKANVRALERAAGRNIPTAVLTPNAFQDEEDYVDAVSRLLEANDINFIVLAGYLKKIPLTLVKAYRGRMLNIHPSLLPAFGGPGMYGIKIHRAVIEKGVRWTGVTIHFVDEEYDSGPIFLQKPVAVHTTDSPEELAKRVLAVEHRIYPEALRLVEQGRVQVVNGKVIIDPVIISS